MDVYSNIIAFIKETERLKNNTRTAWTSEGRQESIADHSWRLTLFCMVLEEYFQDIDFNRVLRLALIHDLGEAYDGDTSATVEVNHDLKLKKEGAAIHRLTTPLSKTTQAKLKGLWVEYNKGETKEAKLVKALDKIETIIQHNQGKNPPHFNYLFNLEYGKKLSLFDPIVQSIREIVDQETRHHINPQQEFD